jgi:tetratricopeptide (TPR) repeat protein
MKDKTLHTALALSKKGKYGAAIKLLEGEIMRFRDSFRFYYILGLSCLRSGDFGRAYTYFKSAHDIKSQDVNVLLGIAALNVKRGESGRALDLYFKVLNIESENKTAKYALAALRKHGGGDTLVDWLESGGMQKLYPPFLKEKFAFLKPALLFCGVCALFAIGLLAAAKLDIITLPFYARAERDGFSLSALSKDDESSLVEIGGVYDSILTAPEVSALYDGARKSFNAYKDNSARVAINKILLSNAAAGIKNKARLLLGYIDQTTPGFDSLTERFSYDEVRKESRFYNGCYVIWSGMATNVSQSNTETAFDFLAGYDPKGRQLLGTVRVTCPFAFTVNTERPLEILGAVAAQEDGGFTLTGVSIHPL